MASWPQNSLYNEVCLHLPSVPNWVPFDLLYCSHIFLTISYIPGKEYTFVVETGLGTDPKGTFHPLYITNDAFGGRQLKTELEAKAERVYSGVTLGRQGSLVPSAMGKLCRWSSPRPGICTMHLFWITYPTRFLGALSKKRMTLI